jgi:hypothetical protein
LLLGGQPRQAGGEGVGDAQVHACSGRQREQAQTLADEGLEIRTVQGDEFGLGPDCHRRDERIGLERAFAAGGIEQLGRQLGGVLTDRQDASFEGCARQTGFRFSQRAGKKLVSDQRTDGDGFPRQDARNSRMPLPRPVRQRDQGVGVEMAHPQDFPARRASSACRAARSEAISRRVCASVRGNG